MTAAVRHVRTGEWHPPSCGKHAFPTQAEAFASMRSLRARTKDSARERGRLRVYRCPVCVAYHFGHTKP